MRKTVLLWISDSPLVPTGFGRVTFEILTRLAAKENMDIHALAVGAGTFAYSPSTIPFRILPCPSPDPPPETLREAIDTIHPDVVVTLSDIWRVNFMLEVKEEWKGAWIGYFPIDAGPLPQCFKPILERMDCRVTTSEFSAAVFRQAFPRLDIHVAKHGVDADRFHPGRPTRGRLKLPDGRQAFVIGCVARNQPRLIFLISLRAPSRISRRMETAI